MSGQKIIEALEEAARGDFSRVTTHGHIWVRDGVDKAYAWDAVIRAREDERRRCAEIAEAIDSGRGNEKQIAAAIRALGSRRSPQEAEGARQDD